MTAILTYIAVIIQHGIYVEMNYAAWATEAGLVVNFWRESIETDVSVDEWDILLLLMIVVLKVSPNNSLFNLTRKVNELSFFIIHKYKITKCININQAHKKGNTIVIK